MSKERLISPPVASEQIHSLLQQLGSYDDPCMLLLYANRPANWREQTLSAALESHRDNASQIVELTDKLSFVLVFCDSFSAQVIADDILAMAKPQGVTAYLALFRHNCLGEPIETFSWLGMQLSQLGQDAQVQELEQAQAINDFQDKANWPGIEQYVNKPEVEPYVEPEPVKPSLFQRVVTGFASLFKGANKLEGLAEFECPPALNQMKPFIENLANGSLLWQYVLTGKGKAELVQRQALVDLDHVLFLPHAKQFAPEFYHKVLEGLSVTTLTEQNEVQQYIARALFDLIEQLLEAEHNRANKQACCVRVFELLYYLFDQQPWPDEVQQLLVEDEDTACLDQYEYDLLFTEAEPQVDGIPPLLQQHILELLDQLQDYHFACQRQWQKINKLFSRNRQAFDPNNWSGTEPTSKLLLASILLYQDKQAKIKDNATEALERLVDELLMPQVIKLISEDLAFDTRLPTGFTHWLQDSDEKVDLAAIAQLRQVLASDIGLDADRTIDSPQPHYQLFSHISDFQPVLASCYWLQLASPRPLTAKVVAMSLAIAPQASLSCFAHLQLKTFGKFPNEQDKKQTFARFWQLGVDDYDALTFDIRVTQPFDSKRYKRLVRKYARCSQAKRERWDKALAKATPSTRDYFYLDVYRLANKVVTPLLSYRTEMLQELIANSMYCDEELVTAALEPEQVLFSDHIEFLPECYHLPLTLHQEPIRLKPELEFAVFIATEDTLALVAHSDVDKFTPSQGVQAQHYIILSADTDMAKLKHLLSHCLDYQSRKQALTEAMQAFVQGQLSYQQYQAQVGYYSDTKQYDLRMKHYCKYSPRILPQLLAEPDKSCQLRLIKLLCSHRSRGKRVFKDIAEQMFFDDCLQQGSADFAQLHEGLEVEQLTDDWIETWHQFKHQLELELAAVE